MYVEQAMKEDLPNKVSTLLYKVKWQSVYLTVQGKVTKCLPYCTR
jgi:hypothetical protein